MLDKDVIPSPQGRKAFLVGLLRAGVPAWEVDDHLDELEELAGAVGADPVGRAIQRRKAPHPATFIGSGKAEQIALASDTLEAEIIIFDDDLSPSQVKNLEKIFKRPVMDRSGLILEIFRDRARTGEARTQVDLARLQYLLPRLTRMWGHLGRQVGGIGVRGGEGEKQLEVDRRIIRRRIKRLESQLAKITRTRSTQRLGRREAVEIALAGYTNAGKSTLFNQLTGSEYAPARDRLFETLDSKLRRGYLGEGVEVVYADTVGFIRKLPHHLVASFKSTLEEVTEADLVLHVVDASHPKADDQREVAEAVMEDLGVDPDRVLLVWNKVDRLHHAPQDQGVAVSALNGQGLEDLRRVIRQKLTQVVPDKMPRIAEASP